MIRLENVTKIYKGDVVALRDVSADIQNIWIIDGGLAVTLGRGGADMPGDLQHG